MTWIYNATPGQEDLSKWATIVTICVITTAIMAAVFTARWILCKKIASFKWELGLLTLSAEVCSIIFNALCIQQTRYGLGLALQDRPKADTSMMFRYNYVGRPFYFVAIGSFKASLLVGYLRITSRTSRAKFRMVVIAMLLYCGLCTPAYILVNLLNCKPIYRAWIGPSVPGTCLSYGATNYVISSMNVTADCITFSLPWSLVSFLSMDARQKRRFCGAFALGFITTVFSGLRIWGLHFNNDGHGDLVFVVLFGSMEANVGIIAACIPFIIPKGKFKSSGGLRFDFIKTPPTPIHSDGKLSPLGITKTTNFLVERGSIELEAMMERQAAHESLRTRPRHIPLVLQTDLTHLVAATQGLDPHDWSHE